MKEGKSLTKELEKNTGKKRDIKYANEPRGWC